MKIENIVEGQIIKNYKELCLLLGEKVRASGKSKILHHEDMERYFEYRKDGHKYIIENIYIEPIERINNREVYCTLINKLILSKLANEKVLGNKIDRVLDEYNAMSEIELINMNKYKYDSMMMSMCSEQGIKLIDYTIKRYSECKGDDINAV